MKRYSVTLAGKRKRWGFTIRARPEHVEGWRADGLEVDELLHSFPEWMPTWARRLSVRLSDLAWFRG